MFNYFLFWDTQKGQTSRSKDATEHPPMDFVARSSALFERHVPSFSPVKPVFALYWQKRVYCSKKIV
jgi:hypothetical protein